MASKVVLLIMACFLLVNTRVSAEWDEEILTEGTTLVPAGSPLYKTPPQPPPPVVKEPPPPVKAPPPPPPVVKAPPPPPPPATAPVPSPPVKPPRNRQECIPLCVVRCRLHSRKNICLRACLTCCERCKCVPPGQYGNKEKCGKCYAGMTTRGGKPKCP
ncbi:hypothetical protein CDL12_12851 [Handroanthus impetiginosus]|uniref:Gibberellin regulated protein n=1 Tax=Handroanthus impetiginosus TaxID=429701 RepID=A0A2G9HAG0_9LAMI|nr:hypothetical protein CDL12_12851 [Handroanthus impetiginosus]